MRVNEGYVGRRGVDWGWIKYVLDFTRSWYSRMRSKRRLISREKPSARKNLGENSYLENNIFRGA